MNQNEIREKITAKIITALETGALPPWRAPWNNDPNAGLPANVVSKKCLAKYRVGQTVPTNTDYITHEEADRVIAATETDIRYGGNRAFYSLMGDFIQVPTREQFTASYYETVFHELCHWSENRLDWKRGGEEGTYAMGELIAEMGSCFLVAELGIPVGDTLPNHASFLEHWLKAMKNDTKFIFQASSQASKAADFILSFSREVEEEDSEAALEAA